MCNSQKTKSFSNTIKIKFLITKSAPPIQTHLRCNHKINVNKFVLDTTNLNFIMQRLAQFFTIEQ